MSDEKVNASGLALLDAGQPRKALRVFQRLLRLRRQDPDHPTSSAAEQQSVLPWLVRAHAAVLRESAHTAAARSAASSAQTKMLPGGSTGVGGTMFYNAYDHYRILRCVLDIYSNM